MSNLMLPISAEQVRAGSALLQWSEADLAKHADVTILAITDIEVNNGNPVQKYIDPMKAALERAGGRLHSGRRDTVTPETATAGTRQTPPSQRHKLTRSHRAIVQTRDA